MRESGIERNGQECRAPSSSASLPHSKRSFLASSLSIAVEGARQRCRIDESQLLFTPNSAVLNVLDNRVVDSRPLLRASSVLRTNLLQPASPAYVCARATGASKLNCRNAPHVAREFASGDAFIGMFDDKPRPLRSMVPCQYLDFCKPSIR